MNMPINLIIDREVNIYGLTNAVIRRAHQLTLMGEEEKPGSNGKIVSSAVEQILTNKVNYRFEE